MTLEAHMASRNMATVECAVCKINVVKRKDNFSDKNKKSLSQFQFSTEPTSGTVSQVNFYSIFRIIKISLWFHSKKQHSG